MYEDIKNEIQVFFSYKELAVLNEMISTALLSGNIAFDEISKAVHQKITKAIMEKADTKEPEKEVVWDGEKN